MAYESNTLHLTNLRESHGAAHTVNVGESLLGSQSLLQRVCGDAVRFEVLSTADAGYVLSTGGHFDQVLMNLVLNCKDRIDGRGLITINADSCTLPLSQTRARSYVRLAARAEKTSTAQRADDALPSAIKPESQELALTIVRAIATASEGFTRVSEPSDSVSLVEVFLPRQESRIAAAAMTNEYLQVVLVIGLQLRFVEAVRRAAGETAVLLEAATLDEAALISELYPGDLDLVILNDGDGLPKARDRACDRIRARRPNTRFLQVVSPKDDSGSDPLNAADLERRVSELLNKKAVPAIAS